ncbi:MAG TPA: c-type cytochrome [Acidimicrobiales bacterium]|nr:c-type cytochrome [Acidimicrobiales bacterium]
MRRRHLLPLAVVAVAAGAGLFWLSGSEPSGAAAPAPASPSPTEAAAAPTTAPSGQPASQTEPTVPVPRRLVPLGRTLFAENCSSCHGLGADGSTRGPNLLGLGAATIDFWVSTGRMPLANPSAQPVSKPPRFDKTQTRAIVAYVTSLAPGGPGIPAVNLSGADEATGFNLFSLNCASCHTITGVGDALSAGSYAPSLLQATPTQIAEAIRIGPGQMPRFSVQQISYRQLNDIVRYVSSLKNPDDRGGYGLGHVGPVTEGFIALLMGLGGLMLISYWVGERA